MMVGQLVANKKKVVDSNQMKRSHVICERCVLFAFISLFSLNIVDEYRMKS